MDQILRTTLIGFLAGIGGTGIGGAAGFVFSKPSRRFLSGLISLSGGLMLAIVSFELLPEAFLLSGVFLAALGLLAGALGSACLDRAVDSAESRELKTAILLGLAIALHNFPEGLAIGSGFAAKETLGFGLAAVIALHNIPEGMAMALPMRIGGYPGAKAFFLTLLAGAPMGVGAYLGAYIGDFGAVFVGLCLSFAAGTMLYITLGELLPKGKALYQGRRSTFFAILGMVLGVFITKVF